MREIGGGCFCCKSESLIEVMEAFSEKVQPHVLIGEPVGSCTDLVSTVLGPLRTIYHTSYELAPLSVLVDPFRAERIVNEDTVAAMGFSRNVNYIYSKQLEEAEIIVVNKCDVFAPPRLANLCARLKEQYPKAEVLQVSARTGDGLEGWWERLLIRTHANDDFMSVDYAVYADGEALLGWVNGEYLISINATLSPKSSTPIQVDGNQVLKTIAASIRDTFVTGGVEVAHLKMSLKEMDGEETDMLGTIQWVRSDSEPEFTQRLPEPLRTGRLLLNLRAEADPEFLSEAIERAIAATGPQLAVRKVHYSAFKPAPPSPTHRMRNVS